MSARRDDNHELERERNADSFVRLHIIHSPRFSHILLPLSTPSSKRRCPIQELPDPPVASSSLRSCKLRITNQPPAAPALPSISHPLSLFLSLITRPDPAQRRLSKSRNHPPPRLVQPLQDHIHKDQHVPRNPPSLPASTAHPLPRPPHRSLQSVPPFLSHLIPNSPPADMDHTPQPHPASPTSELPDSFASYRQRTTQHGPLHASPVSEGAARSGASLGSVQPSKGVFFDRDELPVRFHRTPLVLEEIEAIETGGASMFA